MKWSKAKVAVVSTVTVAVAVGATFSLNWILNPRHLAEVKGERLIARKLAAPLDLTARVQTPASYFKQISQFPAWQFVPTGFQTFRNVPLQIDGMICLYGEGNARVGLKFPEACTDIPINQKFETLYVYHATFYSSPAGTPVYNLVLRYEDGSSATNQILYCDDVLDWYANGVKKVACPTDPRSKVAWHGEADLGAKKQPLRFCLTAVENPCPGKTVTAIDLYSCKSQSAGCILAFTPGKAGLMH